MRGMRTWISAFALLSLPLGVAGAAPVGRGWVAGKYMLELGGKAVCYVASVEGGALSAEVVEEALGGSSFVRKHIGRPKFGDITMRLDASLGQPVRDWIDAMLAGKPERRNGAVVAADFNNVARSRLEFTNALISEIAFPALDAADKDPAYLVLKIAPEALEYHVLDGTATVNVETSKQKLWHTSNFRVRLGDLPTKRVNKIEALTIKQKISESAVGDSRDYEKEPGKLEIPDLRVAFAEADAKPWLDWFEDFVTDGNNTQEDEIDGAIELLDAQGGVIATLDLSQVGIFRLDLLSPPEDAVRRVKAEMYCEEMSFHWGAPAR